MKKKQHIKENYKCWFTIDRKTGNPKTIYIEIPRRAKFEPKPKATK